MKEKDPKIILKTFNLNLLRVFMEALPEFKIDSENFTEEDIDFLFVDINFLQNSNFDLNKFTGHYFLLGSIDSLLNLSDKFIKPGFLDYFLVPIDKIILRKKFLLCFENPILLNSTKALNLSYAISEFKQEPLKIITVNEESHDNKNKLLLLIVDKLLKKFKEHRVLLQEYFNVILNPILVKQIINQSESKIQWIKKNITRTFLCLETIETTLNFINLKIESEFIPKEDLLLNIKKHLANQELVKLSVIYPERQDFYGLLRLALIFNLIIDNYKLNPNSIYEIHYDFMEPEEDIIIMNQCIEGVLLVDNDYLLCKKINDKQYSITLKKI